MQSCVLLNRKACLENHSKAGTLVLVCPRANERGREKYNVLSKIIIAFILHLHPPCLLGCRVLLFTPISLLGQNKSEVFWEMQAA